MASPPFLACLNIVPEIYELFKTSQEEPVSFCALILLHCVEFCDMLLAGKNEFFQRCP